MVGSADVRRANEADALMPPPFRYVIRSCARQLVRATVAAALVLSAGLLIYSIIGLNLFGAVLFASACYVIRLVVFPTRH
jgi:hypothetical protein